MVLSRSGVHDTTANTCRCLSHLWPVRFAAPVFEAGDWWAISIGGLGWCSHWGHCCSSLGVFRRCGPDLSRLLCLIPPMCFSPDPCHSLWRHICSSFRPVMPVIFPWPLPLARSQNPLGKNGWVVVQANWGGGVVCCSCREHCASISAPTKRCILAQTGSLRIFGCGCPTLSAPFCSCFLDTWPLQKRAMDIGDFYLVISRGGQCFGILVGVSVL